MQDEDGQTVDSHSISAGLDYPSVGPEHAYLADAGRVSYEPVTDTECMDAFQLLCRTEGIIPAIETAHGLAGAARLSASWGDEGAGRIIMVNLSGRGDKDVATAAEWFRMLPGQENDPVADDSGAKAPDEGSKREHHCSSHRQGQGAQRSGVHRIPACGLPRSRHIHRCRHRSGRERRRCRRDRHPYSDPVMDGPVIQQATTEVLGRGFRLDEVFEVVKAVTEATDAAVVVMTYYNVIDRMGAETFARRLAEAGGAGLSPPTSSPTKHPTGSRRRRSTILTGSSWQHRPPLRRGTGPSRRARADSSTASPSWA